ncbi:MAG TPA: GNAT family N-acetyltransferase [Solirubrobacterales bacterium]|nr:GNAT family N-acetyltransferase [Solirubrobacterales bacterium]
MRLLSPAELTPDQLQAWETLAARAAEPNPFFEPGFAVVAAETLGSADAALLVAEGPSGEWTGCMAVKPIGKLGLRLALSTWNHPYSFLGTPLVDAAHLDEYAAELVEALERRELGRFLVLRDVGEGVVLDAIRAALASAGKAEIAFERSFERAALKRRPEGDYTAHLKSSRRSELRRHRRQLQELLGGEVKVDDLEGGTAALDEFLRLEGASWKGGTGTAMACDPQVTAFFRGMGEWFDQRGRLRMRALKVGDQTVAMLCSLTAGDTVFGFKSCFDEELRRYSPGIQLQLEDFDAFHEEGAARMDSCGEPDNTTLNRFWPDRLRLTTLVAARRGAAARAARAGLEYYYSPSGRRLAARLRNRGKKN